ncbi:hypothetical protein C8Q80DRAFT_1180226 [Daedaleopsis nitida]|nr:hypothetical protein C8Q80DRAFT_1180226 [Daedaleopsis nitida]
MTDEALCQSCIPWRIRQLMRTQLHMMSMSNHTLEDRKRERHNVTALVRHHRSKPVDRPTMNYSTTRGPLLLNRT